MCFKERHINGKYALLAAFVAAVGVVLAFKKSARDGIPGFENISYE